MYKNKSLTIVLPVHNAESRLRRNVRELLELASELTAKFGVLIIDDGSTDSTYEVAEELATYFPQVSVRRHRHCRGLDASIEYVQKRVRSDAVIVHDGVTPINTQQVRTLWRRWIDSSAASTSVALEKASRSNDAIDIEILKSVQASMETALRQVLGFQIIIVPPSSSPIATSADTPRQILDPSHASQRAGVGRIPALPRPKFLSALAEFALGE